MSTKTQNVKNFINQIGKENQLFLFVGSSDTDSESNSPKTQIDLWKESDFSIKVGKDNIVGVVPNVKWARKRTYTPWSANRLNQGNYYAYNDTNGYVYLCISDNRENRIDLQGKNVSNNLPSHISGDVTYDDGYTWKALFKITPSMEKFVNEQWIPVVSFDNYEPIDMDSPFAQIENYCYPSLTKDGGKCALYFKDNVTYFDGNGASVLGVKGNLYKTFDSLLCHECYTTFNENETFISRFYVSETPPASIDIKDPYDTIGEMISRNEIPTSSPYYYLYTANAQSPDEGHVVSVKINLQDYTAEDLQIDTENPELEVLSNSGSGARIRLKTYKTQLGTIHVNGIEILSKGSGYKDIQLELNSADIIGTTTKDQLLSLIEINLDEIDGLGFDPMKVLNAEHAMVDVRIDKPTLNNSNLSIPSSINFYTLVQNPRYNSDYIAGTNENKYTSTLYRTTAKVSVYTPVTNPSPDKTARITKSDGTVFRDLKVGKVTGSSVYSQTAAAQLELKGLEYSEFNNLSNSTITIDGTSFTIKAVENVPQFNQYSGKVLSSKKTTSLDISDVETAIIRINMVKGM